MHSSRVERLHRIARQVAANDASADGELRGLLDDLGEEVDPRAVLLYVFGAALARRIQGATERRASLYLDRFEVPQLHLFNLLVTSVPLVGLATTVANGLLARACADEPSPTIVDVGIGSGRQVVALVETLARAAKERGRAPLGTVTVIGVEPSLEALAEARSHLEAAGRDLDVEVLFHEVHGSAESLTEGDWRRMKALCASRPIVNAAFALHHVSDLDGEDVRDDVLRRLRWLSPRVFVLSEPNLHSHEKDFLTRFHTCFAHFTVVFEAIDGLPIDPRDKNALKVCFFGREIVDMLGSPEELRTERHESTTSWLRRLASAGWVTRLEGPVADHARHAGIAVRPRDGYASIEFGDEPIVSVLCALPRDTEGDLAAAEAAVTRAPPPTARATVDTPEAFDAEAYVTALRAVAMADEVLHERERVFIEEQARLLGVPLDLDEAAARRARGDLDAALVRAGSLTKRTRLAIVRDLIFLARIDGHYSSDERDLIESIAERLGLRHELDALERHAELPKETAGMPSWFRECWFVGTK